MASSDYPRSLKVQTGVGRRTFDFCGRLALKGETTSLLKTALASTQNDSQACNSRDVIFYERSWHFRASKRVTVTNGFIDYLRSNQTCS